MKILHVIEGIQESCGISRFVIEADRALQALGVDSAVVTTRNWNVQADDLQIYQTMAPEVGADAFAPDAVHLHGCWNKYLHRVALWCRKHGIPYVISPHGAWTPWAWQYHRWRKRIAWFLYQKKDAFEASAIHVTVESEADDVTRLGLAQPLCIAPLGVKPPVNDEHIPLFSNRAKCILTLGRLHPKKNVHGLLDAWKMIPQEVRRGWRLVVAGKPSPGMDDYLRQLRTLADNDVEFAGEIMGRAKDRLYQSARLFILPSFSENFGSVVLEALVNGTPVITTSGTPWDITEKQGCGWRTSTETADMRDVMVRAMQASDDELAKMSSSARQFVMDNYSWAKTARILLDAYEKVLEK